MTALALNPDDRYADAKAFSAALDDWLRREIAVRPGGCVAMALAGIAAIVIAAMSYFGLPRQGSHPSMAPVDARSDAVAAKPEVTTDVAKKVPSPVTAKADMPIIVNLKSRRVHNHTCPAILHDGKVDLLN